MPEPNQVRWVGIRPVEPEEDIPVKAANNLPVDVKALTAITAIRARNIQYFRDFARLNAASENFAAQTCWINTPEVPSGEIWVITHISFVNTTQTTNNMRAYVRRSDADMGIDGRASLSANEFFTWIGQLILPEGYWIGVYATYPNDGNYAYIDALGWKLYV